MRARIAMTRQFSACRQAPRTAGSGRAEEVLRKVRDHSRQTEITELAGELLAGQRGDLAAVRGDPVVTEDRGVVGAQPDVGLVAVDSDLEGRLEGLQGVFGDLPVKAAVAEDTEDEHGPGV